MKHAFLKLALIALAAPVLAGPSLPEGGVSFDAVTFQCNAGALQINLDGVSSGSLTVGNVTTGDSTTIGTFRGSASVAFMSGGPGNAVDCRDNNDQVYVLWQEGSSYEFMTLNSAVARGSATQDDIYFETSPASVDCGSGQELTYIAFDQSPPDSGPTPAGPTVQGGTISWSITSGDTGSESADNVASFVSGSFGLYTGTVTTAPLGSPSAATIECTTSDSGSTFTWVSANTNADCTEGQAQPVCDVSVTQDFVPVELQKFDIE